MGMTLVMSIFYDVLNQRLEVHNNFRELLCKGIQPTNIFQD